MPSKYSLKTYLENGIYHVYNRGVEKRKIFDDEQDFKVFLHYLKRYLTEPDKKINFRWKMELNQKIKLLAYCLMDNHFHLLLQQVPKEAMTTFVRCHTNAYTRYYNQKYKRVGPLFQGKFKAVLVDRDNYLLHLSRYIHLNPLGHKETFTRSDLVKLENYSYSSYSDYIGKRKTAWVNTAIILDYFKSNKGKRHSYKDFVEDFLIDEPLLIKEFVIES